MWVGLVALVESVRKTYIWEDDRVGSLYLRFAKLDKEKRVSDEDVRDALRQALSSKGDDWVKPRKSERKLWSTRSSDD